MKPLTSILTLIIFVSCSVQPEPLHFGKDGCHSCKMTLMDSKFGAEIVTKKGKVYKFDDLNCMANFMNSNAEPADNIAQYLVIDFSNPEKLIDATQAYYVQSEQIKSPMASRVAAFEKEQDLTTHNKEWNGKTLRWKELTASLQ